MSDFSKSNIQNLLLRALAREAFDLLRPAVQPVALPVKFELIAPDVPSETADFLESGLASIVSVNSDSQSVEVGHAGYEGMAGAHVLLWVDQTPNRTFMQVEGQGISVPVSALLSMVQRVPSANALLLRYVHCCELQLAHSALANARCTMHGRLARWLLMSHDRLRGDDLPLTYEVLALMLGVRRSGVTSEIPVLEAAHAIRATRGNVWILDRGKLEAIAGGSYGVPEHEYERLIGISFRRT
jgi:CRP-like cAMP-binding protein